MKNKFFLSVLLVALVASQAQSQTIRRVSNAVGANAPYTTIQDALAAAVNGDIILVEGSPTAYTGALSITKPVTIQGPGYLLDQNTGLQVNQNSAYYNTTISFNAGSAGSILRGMWTVGITINTTNITISNNYAVGGHNLDINTGANNIIISGNYFSLHNIRVLTNVTSLLITNNYIGNNILFSGSSTVLGVVNNNTIGGNGNTIANSTITNNIFLSPLLNSISDAFNSTIQNNIFISASQAGADATNVFSATASSLFVGLTGNTTDTQWRLKAGSPAIGVGAGGTDCGMYGGNTPYKISGIFAGQPTISSFTTPGTVPANGTLNVKLSAKVN